MSGTKRSHRTVALAAGLAVASGVFASYAFAADDSGNSGSRNSVEYTVPKGTSVEEQCLMEHRARGENVINIVDRATGEDSTVAVDTWCKEFAEVYPPEGLPAKAGLQGETVLENGHVKIQYYEQPDPSQLPKNISDDEAQRRMDAAR
jgi:hypothetical protein